MVVIYKYITFCVKNFCLLISENVFLIGWVNVHGCVSCLFLLLNCRGEQFRPDYSRLGMVSAFFPNVPLYALTAHCKQMRTEK